MTLQELKKKIMLIEKEGYDLKKIDVIVATDSEINSVRGTFESGLLPITTMKEWTDDGILFDFDVSLTKTNFIII